MIIIMIIARDSVAVMMPLLSSAEGREYCTQAQVSQSQGTHKPCNNHDHQPSREKLHARDIVYLEGKPRQKHHD